MNQLYPVVLAGGGGDRLWPLSRELFPKQLLSFHYEESMLQLTLLRLSGLEKNLDVLAPLILCNEEYRFLVQEHASAVSDELGKVILEPEGRNTAPALTVAALSVEENDSVILLMPADHFIDEMDAFQSAVLDGFELAQEGMLVTFGIKPSHPETGYGYINTKSSIYRHIKNNAFVVEHFVEKPDAKTAKDYVNSGEYYWNSGIFMMKTSVWLSAIQKYRADIYSACSKAYDRGESDGLFFRLEKKAFKSCPNDSIDYAIMEKIWHDGSFTVALVELDAGWTDIGSWSAVWDVSSKSLHNNVIEGDVLAEDTTNSIILAHDRLVATVGVDNLIVVETSDAVLVGRQKKAQDVKTIVNKLRMKRRQELIVHKQVFRPWGSYISIDSSKNFQVKRLIVNPGKKLSLQLHHQHTEHWVVVSGVATIICGKKTFDLNKNESTYIPVETKHRLENKTDQIIEIIEIQSGDYLGEDDIVRFDDDFGRT